MPILLFDDTIGEVTVPLAASTLLAVLGSTLRGALADPTSVSRDDWSESRETATEEEQIC